jgi:hypothetical protein
MIRYSVVEGPSNLPPKSKEEKNFKLNRRQAIGVGLTSLGAAIATFCRLPLSLGQPEGTNYLETVLLLEFLKAKMFCYTDMGIKIGPSNRDRFLETLGKATVENAYWELDTFDPRLKPLREQIRITVGNNPQGNLSKEDMDKILQNPEALRGVGESVLQIIKPDPEGFPSEFKKMVCDILRGQIFEGHATTVGEIVFPVSHQLTEGYWYDPELTSMVAEYMSIARGKEFLTIDQIRSDLANRYKKNLDLSIK